MSSVADRLEVRTSEQDKKIVARAAELRGETVSSFARAVLVREARKILESEEVVTLSAAASRRFVQALDRPFAPNAALRKAMAKADKLGL
ncbi:MAG: DUF1778 domain-containing protein [Rudaea sp.]|uniref:type II toxin-antitoxin system TacA family antitoxin n=1 Tax=Rudaea sp. TaxID=2136325 RepID=UPI0039E4DEAD